MASYKMSRTSEDILRELTAILRTVKDPRVNGPQGAGMLSIVRVEVTNDMSYATVYISSMDGLEAAKEAVRGLKSAAGYMRRELGQGAASAACAGAALCGGQLDRIQRKYL